METNKKQAGIIGLGMIGGGVAISLTNRGRIPVVYDIRPDASDNLAGVPAPLRSPAEVAEKSDVVMVAVLNAEQAREVIGGENGLLSAAHERLTIVLLSTIAYNVVKELGELCAKYNVGFLDCGVTPGDKAAENGMVAMIGGDPETISHAMPILEDWAKQVIQCGPLGSGMTTKIARNLVTYGSWRAIEEAKALLEAAGSGYMKLKEVMETADPEGQTIFTLLRLRNGSAELPKALGTQIEPLMMKDLAAAKSLAQQLDVEIPLTEVTYNNAYQTLGLMEDSVGSDEGKGIKEHGYEVMDRVYGQGFSNVMRDLEVETPLTQKTVEHLFAEIWGRPGLSIRDRRLLVIGATAALGRADLIKVQAEGALANNELDINQLNEAALQLAYYIGWGNATEVQKGIVQAKDSYEEKKAKS